jgi:hypothetical protein
MSGFQPTYGGVQPIFRVRPVGFPTPAGGMTSRDPTVNKSLLLQRSRPIISPMSIPALKK